MTIKFLAPALACAMALVSACSQKPSDAADRDPLALAPTISVTEIVLRPIGGTATASGLLTPREEAAVGSELSGYRVAEVLVEEGARVKKGQVLARLDSGLLQARIAQAEAGVAQADAQAEQARSEADRVAGLDGTGILSDEQIGSRRSQAKSANASVQVAQAQLNDLRAQEQRLQIRAPVAGLVLERAVRPGDVASPSQPMFRIARDGLIELDAEIPEDKLAAISVGDAAGVTTSDGATIKGKVRLVSPRVDPQTKLGRVRISLPVDASLRAGGYARATFSSSTNAVKAVAEKAVQFEAGGPRLIVIDGENRAHPVPVRTGGREGGYVVIEQGPPIGTRVAMGSGSTLLDGDLVRPVIAEAPAQQAVVETRP